MSGKKNNSRQNKIQLFLQRNSVPMMFILICAVCIPLSGFSAGHLANEIVTRMGQHVSHPEPADSDYGRHGLELWHDAGRDGGRNCADIRCRSSNLGHTGHYPGDDYFDTDFDAAGLDVRRTAEQGART